MSHRKSGSISPGTQQVLSKKVSLYIRGQDNKDTIGSGRLELCLKEHSSHNKRWETIVRKIPEINGEYINELLSSTSEAPPWH